MNKDQKEWFEKGRDYEHLHAEQAAEEKAETLMICLLERIIGGEGEIFIPNIDLMLAKRRFVSFQTKDHENGGIKLNLVKEITSEPK